MSQVNELLQKVSAKLEEVSSDFSKKAEEALTEARNSGSLSAETKASVDKIALEHNVLNESLKTLKASVGDLEQHVASMPLNAAKEGIQSVGQQLVSAEAMKDSRAENNKVLRDATRAGAEVLKDEVIARAPVRTGKLKKNVVVVTQKSRRRGEICSGVHIRGVNPRTGNSDNTMKANNPRNAFYWRFVELGTANMPAHPFVRPAYDTREEEAASVAIARMNQAIDEVLSK